jgi:hypothetical protein
MRSDTRQVSAARRIVIAGGLALALVSQPAFALTYKEGAENMLYFEHARLSTAHCEQQGAAVRPAFDAWRARNDALYRASVQAVRLHGEKGGLSSAQLDDVMAQAGANQTKQAQDQIARKGVSCGNFRGVLQMYDALFKR